MAEPNRAKTFYDLILEVADQLSVNDFRSNGTKIIPKDQYNFETCKDIVNNAVEMFMSDAPKKGWRWMRRIASVTFGVTVTGTATAGTSTSLTDGGIAGTYADDYFNGYVIYIEDGTGKGEYATVTDYTGSTGKFDFTALSGASTPDTTSDYTIALSTNAINGDGSRYKLPANFGGTVDGDIEYAKDSNRGTNIEWRDESYIRARRSVTLNTGYPLFAAIRPYEPTDENLSATRQWEIVFDPRPSASDTIEFPYTLYFDKMLMEMGTATSGAATYLCDTSRYEANDYFNSWIIEIIDGTGKGETATVTDYDKATGKFSFTALSSGSTPDTTSVYVVYPASNLHPAGHQFDASILAACRARAEMDEQDEHMDTFWTEYYHKKALPNAYIVDARSAPRKLGSMNISSDRRVGRSYNNVVTDNDI